MSAQNQEYQVLDQELVKRIKEEVRRYINQEGVDFGAVHVWFDGVRTNVAVDDRMSIVDDEVTVMFFEGGGEYAIVVDGVLATAGDAEHVRKKMREKYEWAREEVRRDGPLVGLADQTMYIAEVFFAVDEALTEDP